VLKARVMRVRRRCE